MNFDYGQFGDDGRTFVVTNPRTPRHWYNMFWNDRYVSLFSQVGEGESLTQDPMGNRIEVVAQRAAWLHDRDTGRCWAANALPLPSGDAGYTCTHGMGYSTIRLETEGVASEFRVFVPSKGACEVWSLTLTNQGEKPRHLAFLPYVDARLGGSLKPQAYYMAQGKYETDINALILTSPLNDGLNAMNYMALDRDIRGFDTRHASFIGYGTDQTPDAMIAAHCTNSEVVMEKGVLAMETEVVLNPGERTTIHCLVGAATSTDEIAELRARLFAPGGVDTAFADMQEQIQDELGPTRLTTPEADLNALLNPWIKRQISLGIQWARVRHNGFRDQMQDIGAFAFIQPEVAARQLRRVLAFQYSNGYAPRTWLDGEIHDHGFSDNHVWIPLTVRDLIMETGDLGLLDELIPFNDGSEASLYEHTKRAVDHLWGDRADNGLCRIHKGDWNDCLKLAGPEGRGVSVWLSQAWCLANRRFAELARMIGRDDDADLADHRGRQMDEAINAHGWDGGHYLRAIDDDGNPIGSAANDQGRCFLNTQTWAVLADIGDAQRQDQAMAAVAERLETDIGTITVESPYSRWHDNIGPMCNKLPGAQENGGVYLHAGMFKLVAHCLRKEHEQVETMIRQMVPVDHSVFVKDCEPYVLCNSYFAVEGSYRRGTTGQSWGTGAAGWFYVAMLNHVFGIQPTPYGLIVDPCLPPSWASSAVHRRFRGADYTFTFDTSAGYERIAAITVNDATFDATVLPWVEGESFDVRITMA